MAKSLAMIKVVLGSCEHNLNNKQCHSMHHRACWCNLY